MELEFCGGPWWCRGSWAQPAPFSSHLGPSPHHDRDCVCVCVWVLRRISMFTASANTFRELRDKHRKVCSALRRMEVNLALTEGKKL